jgi:hypothetical protein
MAPSIEITLSFHLTPVRMGPRKQTITNAGEDVGKRNTSALVMGM